MGGTKVGVFLLLSANPVHTHPYRNDWQYGVRVLGTGSSSPAYRAKAAAKPAMPTKACAATVTIGMASAFDEAEDAAEAAEDATAEEADAATDDAALEAEDATLDAEDSADDTALEAEADLADASLDLDASEALDELALAAVIEL